MESSASGKTSNLRVVPNAYVKHIVMANGVATGVVARVDGVLSCQAQIENSKYVMY